MIPPETPTDSPAAARRLLWRGTEVVHRRHENDAVALIAIRSALERDRPLEGGEREFLSLYTRASEADPELFTRVWTDPTACFWVRTTCQLLATVLTGAQLLDGARAYCRALGNLAPRAALVRQLSGFKRFILALDHLGAADGAFETPLCVDLPFALPGTALSLEGRGAVEIHGLRAGTLRLRHDDREWSLPLVPGAGDAVRVLRCPVAEYEGCELRLQPQIYNNLPGLDFVEPVLQADPALQTEHQNLVREALSLVAAHHPECFGQLRKLMQVVALKPLEAGGYTTSASCDLPGAFVIGVVNHPYELADTLIHEFHHDRLFAIEQSHPFFDETQDSLQDQTWYSPWRDDPRPLHGILHGVYVFQPVWMFWRSVHAGEPIDGRLLDYARDRLLRIALQLSIGASQLERHAPFSAIGASLFSELDRGLVEIQRNLREAVGDRDVPAYVCREDGTIERERSALSGEPMTVRQAVQEHELRFNRGPG